jgi:leucyl aminopeptidase
LKFSYGGHKAPFLVFPFWEGGEAAADFPKEGLSSALHDFRGEKGETLLLYKEDQKICLLGLGKRQQPDVAEAIRRAYGEATKIACAKKARSVGLFIPSSLVHPAIEGLLLANYDFRQKSSREGAPVLIEEVHLLGMDQVPGLERLSTIADSIYFARDLINGNADDITPQKMVDVALGLPRPIEVKVLNKKRLEEEGMGLLLAVNRASHLDPFLIEASYTGDPSSDARTVLVGKGITYDTGGLSLKTSDGMLDMKCDMSGAATVLAAVRAAAALKLKVNVTAVTPLTENAIGPKSYKIGDVYVSASKKTVRITNTDAEGRLVLADALTYAQKHLRPTRMIDIASLTGSIVRALGTDIAGLFSSDETLSRSLLEASQRTGEKLWAMPLHDEYFEGLRSNIADFANAAGAEGGAIVAALFLKQFVQDVPWAHIDFAGTCYWEKPKRYYTTNATGYGVRLLVDFLESAQ